MTKNKPPSRRVIARSAESDPRDLRTPPPTLAERAALAEKANFGPYSKHKKNPSAYKLQPYAGEDEDPTYCDDDAKFMPDDMKRAPELLVRGIQAGLFGDKTNKGDPSLLWTVDDNGWIYEARITNPGYGGYHAYPVLRHEAIARKVLARYRDYVENADKPELKASLKNAESRYA